MPKVVIYTTNYCPFCASAKALLRTKHIDFEEIDITLDEHLREEVTRLSGRRTAPQIFIDGKSVGGFDDIKELDMSGELNRLLGIQP